MKKINNLTVIIVTYLTDKKKMVSFGISVIFKPKIPLTKKNF